MTNAKSIPPSWKYCQKCAEKLGIDYDAQTPDSNLSKKELERKNRLKQLSKIAAQKSAETRRKKNKSTTIKQGQKQEFLCQ